TKRMSSGLGKKRPWYGWQGDSISVVLFGTAAAPGPRASSAPLAILATQGHADESREKRRPGRRLRAFPASFTARGAWGRRLRRRGAREKEMRPPRVGNYRSNPP